MSGAPLDAPTPITVVLVAALAALGSDERFRNCPGGNIEIAWRQPSKGRDGNPDRPARYCFTVEFLYDGGAAGAVDE